MTASTLPAARAGLRVKPMLRTVTFAGSPPPSRTTASSRGLSEGVPAAPIVLPSRSSGPEIRSVR